MEIICGCFGVSKEDIVDAINSGLTTVSAIADETNAGQGCGSCGYVFQETCKSLLEEKKV